ncbi:uncharacterized protein LOC117229625 [Megalopta genalis]|uniref:uncharacterized protein LOC117229625 n=1 Tax=Megalopta genalis TaxID=115081 RepID=UPI003FD2E2C1
MFCTELAKAVGEFPHCRKSHSSPTFLPLNLDASTSTGQNRKDKRVNGLSVFVGATEQRVPIKEQAHKANKLKDPNLPSRHSKKYKNLCKSIWCSSKKKSVSAGQIFFKKGDTVVFNFKHLVSSERIVAEYARAHLYDKPRFVKVDRKESAKSLLTTNREKTDSDVEQYKIKQSFTRERTRSTEPGWKLNKSTESSQRNIKRATTKVSATHNFVYQFDPFATSKGSFSVKVPKGGQNSSNVGQGDNPTKCLNLAQSHEHSATTLPKLPFRRGLATVNAEKGDVVSSKKNTNLPDIGCQETEAEQRLPRSRGKRNLIGDIDREVEKVKSDWQALRSHGGDSKIKTFLSNSKSKKLYETLDDMTRELERIQKSYLDPRANQYLQRGAMKVLESSEPSFQEKADMIKEALFPKAAPYAKPANAKTADDVTKNALLPHGSYAGLSTEKYSAGRSMLGMKQCRKSVARPSSKSTPNLKKGNSGEVPAKSQKSEIEDYLEGYISSAERNFRNVESGSNDVLPSTDDMAEIIKKLNVQSFDMFDATDDEEPLPETRRDSKDVKDIKDETCTRTRTRARADNAQVSEDLRTEKLSLRENNKTLCSDSSIQTGVRAERTVNPFMEMSLQSLNVDLPETVLSRVLRSEYLLKDVSLKPM